MTPTELRLTDALAYTAGAVREEALRPLEAPPDLPVPEVLSWDFPVEGTEGLLPAWGVEEPRPAGGAWPGRRPPRWLVPAAAAASVIFAVGLAFALSRLFLPAQMPQAFADVGTATSPPPYYVSVESERMAVHATATGWVTDTVGPPREVVPVGSGAAVASSADGRVFVVAYSERRAATRLYRFSLTQSGEVAGFTPARGGVLPSLTDVTLAVSPDGSRVAVGGSRARRWGARPPAQIAVINLRTGARTIWQGGMSRPGTQFTIASLSWAGNGRSLVFLGRWCRTLSASVGCASGHPLSVSRVTQVREVDTARPGRSLAGGRLLVSGAAGAAAMLQALISRDGKLITAMVTSAQRVRLVTVSVPVGRVVHVLYQRRAPRTLTVATLASDGSGRYLLMNENRGAVAGWVYQGRFHPVRHAETYLAW